MGKNHNAGEDTPGGGAIEQVLDEERRAREGVTEATSQAESMLEDARSAARRAQARADRRITRLHKVSDESVTRRISTIEARAKAEEQRVAAAEVAPEALQAAIEDVARLLTGGDDADAAVEDDDGDGER